MNRDPTKVGRARVGAELIAEVVNGFVEPISWKTLVCALHVYYWQRQNLTYLLQIFTITSLSFLTVFVNSLLSLYRSRHNPANAQSHVPTPIPSFPVTPVAPYSHSMIHGQPGWDKSWTGHHEVEDVPARRRKLENGAVKDVR
jgi:hypothetical protein